MASKSTKPLAWHLDTLSNFRLSIAAEEKRVEFLIDKLARMKKDEAFYVMQIEEARQRGLTEFDRDRLLMPRVAKAV